MHGMKALKITAVVLFIIIGLVCGLLSMRKDWVQPVPGVDLTPPLSILPEEDVPAGSAFDLLLQATAACSNWTDATTEEYHRLSTNAWSDAAFSNLAAHIATSEPCLQLARAAVDAGNPQVPTVNFDSDLTYVSRVRSIGRTLVAASLRDAHYGRYDRAFERAALATRLGDVISRGGPLINRLVAFSCWDLGCRAMRRIAVRHHDVPASVLNKAITGLGEAEMAQPRWSDLFRWEWVSMRAAIDAMYDDPVAAQDMMWLGHAAHFARLGGSREATMADLEACYTHIVYAAEHPLDTVRFDALKTTLSDARHLPRLLLYRDPMGLVLASMMLPSVDLATRRHLCGLITLRATRLFLAVAWFRRKDGQLPETLEQLIPAYIGEIPNDPFDEQPLRYARVNDRHWKIYSVGADRVDNGGDAAPPNHGIFSGKDIALASRDFLPEERRDATDETSRK